MMSMRRMDLKEKEKIVAQLKLRNSREYERDKYIYDAYAELWQTNDQLSKQCRQMSLQVEQLKDEADNHGGADGAKVHKRIEELKDKFREKEEKSHKKIEELQERLRQKDEKFSQKSEELMDEVRRQFKAINDITTEKNSLKTILRQVEENLDQKNVKCNELYKKNVDLQDFCNSLTIETKKKEEQVDELKKKLTESNATSDSLSEELAKANRLLQQERDTRRNSEQLAHQENLERQVRSSADVKLSDLSASTTSFNSSLRKSSYGPAKSKSNLEYVETTDKNGSVAHQKTSLIPQVVRTFWDAHDSDVTALCFSSQGRYLATGGSDKSVRAWPYDGSTGQVGEKIQLQGCGASILSVQFDDHDRYLLAACNDHTARIWYLVDKVQKLKLKGHADKVSAARFCDKCTRVVTGSQDRTLKIWELRTGQCVRTLFAGSSCTDVLIGKQSQWAGIVTGHNDKQIRFWDLRTNAASTIGSVGKITSLDQSPDGRYLLCCCSDDYLRLIDMNQKSTYKTLQSPGFHVALDWVRASFSPCGQYVAAGSSDGSIYVWDVFSGKLNTKVKEHKDQVVACVWHPKGQVFASVEKTKKAYLWGR